MIITQEKAREGNPVYDILFERQDFYALCAGLPNGFLHARSGSRSFYVFDGTASDNHWHPYDDGYAFSLGVRATHPGPDANNEAWEQNANAFYERLEDAINTSGVLPLKVPATSLGKPIDLIVGYAQMRVEPDPSSTLRKR